MDGRILLKSRLGLANNTGEYEKAIIVPVSFINRDPTQPNTILSALCYAKKDSDRGVMNLCSKHYRSIFEGECLELTIRRSQRTRKNRTSSACVSAMHALLI